MDDSDFRTPREKLLDMARFSSSTKEPYRHRAVLRLQQDRRAYGVKTCSEMEIVEAAYGTGNGALYWKAWAGDPGMLNKIRDLLEFHSDENRRYVYDIFNNYIAPFHYTDGQSCMIGIFRNPNTSHILSESAKEYIMEIVPLHLPAAMTPRKKVGRPSGAGSLSKHDEPLILEMKSRIDSGEFTSAAAAARAVASKARGDGTSQEDSIVRRLVGRYKARYRE